jgi:4-hydroxybenzoate polyprenyltransferase
VLKLLLAEMRPKQWAKNVFVLAALVFDQKLLEPTMLLRTLAAAAIFCLLSSVVYLVNDLVDIERDRQHPTKRNRPLASGRLKPGVAQVAAIAFAAIALPCAYLLGLEFLLVAAGYLVLMIAYSFWLKKIVIVDVLTVAAAYVLRVAAGVAAITVVRFSPWLYVCTTLGALFIVVSKRRQELVLLEQNANSHRAVLEQYSVRLLDEFIGIVTATTIIAYSLYTFSAPNVPANHTMMLTIPFVLYGVFRYLYLVHQKGEGGAPEDVILKDKPFLIDILLWGITVVLVMYVA